MPILCLAKSVQLAFQLSFGFELLDGNWHINLYFYPNSTENNVNIQLCKVRKYNIS